MFRKWFSKDPRQLLPWYVNGTLSQRERRVVERWLAQEPEAAEELAAWEQLRAAVRDQPRWEPPVAVRQRVMARAASRRPQRSPGRRIWVWGALLSLVVLVLLWAVVRPGIVLQWEVNTGPVTAFRVYRAPVGSADFELVREMAAQAGAQEYTYVDPRALPGETYVYRVEGVEASGRLVHSAAVTVNGLEALPAQLAVAIAGVVMGCGIVLMAQACKYRRIGLAGLRNE